MKPLREAAAVGRTIVEELRPYFRIDVPIAIFAAVFVVAFAPLIPRNTDNPQLLAAYANDEPFLTMALEATLVWPYGNPGTYFDQKRTASQHVPARWGDKRYFNITYYGGAMFDLALPVYAALRAVGLPPFPTGPIVLRTLTLLAALLSLLVLYNVARVRGSRAAGLLAAVYLASDSYFLYYANFIHPDTLQVLFGLCAFVLALAHSRDGGRSSLIGLGLLCGIVQGTKSGGPWTVPMALVAVWLGVRSLGRLSTSETLRRCVPRVLVLGAATLVGFIVTTPYAVLDSYYARSMRLAYQTVTKDSLQQNGAAPLFSWAKALYEYVGPVATVLVAAVVVRALWGLRKRIPDTTLNLALVLAASQFLWYGAAGRLWQVVGYLLLSMGLIAVFAFETLILGARKLFSLRSGTWLHRHGVALTVALAAVALVLVRWYTPASWEADQYASSRSTVRDANAWAIAQHLSPKTRVVYDDLAYFDHSRFPNARLQGGVLTWPAVDRERPDYIVLSSSLFGAAWMQNLIAEQRLARGDPDPFNVHLYQDLLPTQTPGPTAARGVDLETVIRSTAREPDSRLHSWANSCSGSSLCDASGLDGQLGHVADIEQRIADLAGDRSPIVGPELRIFRVDQRALQSRS